MKMAIQISTRLLAWITCLVGLLSIYSSAPIHKSKTEWFGITLGAFLLALALGCRTIADRMKKYRALDDNEKRELVRYADRRAAGFTLLEMCVVMAVMAILLAIALPSGIQVQAAMNQRSAKQQVSMVAGAVSGYTICNLASPGSSACAQVLPIIPAAGSTVMNGYTYTFSGTVASYTYTADPLPSKGTLAFYSDSSGLVHCATYVATSASPVCP